MPPSVSTPVAKVVTVVGAWVDVEGVADMPDKGSSAKHAIATRAVAIQKFDPPLDNQRPPEVLGFVGAAAEYLPMSASSFA